jgi:hypothetical protein
MPDLRANPGCDKKSRIHLAGESPAVEDETSITT